MENNNSLNKIDIEEIRESLLKRKEDIIKDLTAIGKHDDAEKGDYKVSFPEYGNKDDENAQEINEYTTNLATEQVLESTLKDIDSAIERIDKGSYGVCKYCGKQIGKNRMQARPVANSCVECKTKLQEQG